LDAAPLLFKDGAMMQYTRGWQNNGKCVTAPESDKQAFVYAFPTREVAKDINRRYCSRCPVRSHCLNWAYDDHAFSGIAGGKAFVGDKASGKGRRVVEIPED
jgi:hypothetical protein